MLMATNEERRTLADVARYKFGVAIRVQRTARGLTQEVLAKKMSEYGIPTTQTTIAKIERGDRPTPISEAAVIAHIFDLPLAGLLPTDPVSEQIAKFYSLHASMLELMDENMDLMEQYIQVERRRLDLWSRFKALAHMYDKTVRDMREGENGAQYRHLGADLRTTDELGLKEEIFKPEAGGGSDHGEHSEEA